MNDKLREALERAERKLAAYVGVCDGDKELTDAVLPMVREALAASKPEPQRCKTCDGTGDIHRIDGEYLGECPHCKPEPVGINGLTYAEESATASVLGIVNSKPEPQAQVAPKVVGYLDEFGNFEHGKRPWMEDEEKRGVKWEPIITLQSHREAMEDQRKAIEFEAFEYRERIVPELREAIAKKDAALKACVEALMLARNKLCRVNDPIERHVADAAITQAEGAMR